MRIDRLIMSGFGRFQGKVLELSPGFNILVGPNEAGKTTIQKFILGMLYGFKKRTQRRDFTEDVARYRPWGGGDYNGALLYTLANGRTYRVERDFDPARDETRVFDELTGTDLTEKFPQDRRKEVLFAEEHTKLSEEVFRSTAWVGQLQVGQLELGRELLTRLANMQDSGRDDLSVKEALQNLEERVRQIGSERAPTRPYARVIRSIAEKQEELDRVTSIWEQVRRWEVRLVEARSALEQIDEEQAELLRRLDWALWKETAARLERVEAAGRRLQERQREAESLTRYAHFPVGQRDRLLRCQAEAEEASRRAAAAGAPDLPMLEAELARLKSTIAEMDQIMDPLVAASEQGDDVVAQAEAIDAKIAKLRAELDRQDPGQARGLISALKREARAASGMVWVWLILCLLLVAGGGYLYLNGFVPVPLDGSLRLGLEAGLGGLGLICLVLAIVNVVKARRAGADMQEAKSQMELAYETLETARRQVPELEEEKRRLLKTVGAASLGDVHRASTRYQAMIALREKHQARIDQIESQLGGLRVEIEQANRAAAEVEAILHQAGVTTIDQFETACTLAEAFEKAYHEAATVDEMFRSLLGDQRYEDLEAEVARLGTKLQGEEPVIESRSATQLQEEVRRLQARRADLSATIGDLSARVETNAQDMPEVADLTQEIEALQQQKEAFDEELAALELARSAMEAAAEEIHRDFAPMLNAAMAKGVLELTGGRYKSVKVGDDLSIRAVTEGDRMVDLLSLSGGTVDQFYLGLRLALLEMIQGVEPIPLMLDDPFVQYDDGRVRSAMSLLGSVAPKHQIIFMTCHQREVRIARELGLDVNVTNLAADEPMEEIR